jgi:bifunctional N-acetylglucosamine-1-phosphate-uridyltransferase/glucosamine-1-phosphate-acetyltransferase GlmU-like protein
VDNLISLLILAGGVGARFGSDKQIHRLSSLKLPLLAFSLQDAVKNGIDHVVIVTRSELADFFENNIFPHFPTIRFDLVFQDQALPKLPEGRVTPWGTGHAVLCARECIGGNFIVINADDFYGLHAMGSVVHFLRNSHPNQFCCVGYPLSHTLSANGPISRGIIQVDAQNFVTAITEITQIQRQPDGSIMGANTAHNSGYLSILLQPQQSVSLNLFGPGTTAFSILEQKFQEFLQINHHSPSAEFYLPTALTASDILNKTVAMAMLATQDRWLGITYKSDLPFVEDQLEKLVADGVYV